MSGEHCTALVISGPTGPTGPSGLDGPTGSAGSQGPTGASAPAGVLFVAGTAHLPAGTDVSISYSFPTGIIGVHVQGNPGPAGAFVFDITSTSAKLNAGGSTCDVSWLAFGN